MPYLVVTVKKMLLAFSQKPYFRCDVSCKEDN